MSKLMHQLCEFPMCACFPQQMCNLYVFLESSHSFCQQDNVKRNWTDWYLLTLSYVWIFAVVICYHSENLEKEVARTLELCYFCQKHLGVSYLHLGPHVMLPCVLMILQLMYILLIPQVERHPGAQENTSNYRNRALIAVILCFPLGIMALKNSFKASECIHNCIRYRSLLTFSFKTLSKINCIMLIIVYTLML